MKIKITNGGSKKSWYHSAIGMEFKVLGKFAFFYKVINGKYESFVDIEHCEVVGEPLKHTGVKIGKLRNGEFVEIDFDRKLISYKDEEGEHQHNLNWYNDNLKYIGSDCSYDIVELYDKVWEEDKSIAQDRIEELLEQMDNIIE